MRWLAVIVVMCACGTSDRAPVIRYTPGGEVTARLETTISVQRMHDGIVGSPTKLPPISTPFALAIGGDGRVHGRALPGEIAGGGTAGAEARAYLVAWKSSEDRPFTATFDALGTLGPVVFDDDPAADHSRDAADDLAQRLAAIVVPAPEQPVGVGAIWTVTSSVIQRPVVVRQTATYTVLARTDDGWKIGIDLRRTAPPQKIDDSTQLVALGRHVHGIVDVAPARLIATGTLELESKMHIRITPLAGEVAERSVEETGTLTITAP